MSYKGYKNYNDYKDYQGYKSLPFFNQAEIVQDFTVEFVKRYIDPRSRTKDQMEQAARSSKQNIAEGYLQKSLEGRLKLLGVSRGSLEELLNDFQDFIRQKKLKFWEKNSDRAQSVRRLVYNRYKNYNLYENYLENPEDAANAMICLINQTNNLLDQKLRWTEIRFEKEGGFRENLFKKRRNFLNNSKNLINFIIFITFISVITVFAEAKTAHAATEFVSVVDTGGAGDYSSLNAWNNGVKTDLTVATTKVFAGTKTGFQLADGASVTGHTSGATATLVHETATQILLSNISGTFQNGEQVWGNGGNYFTLSNTGDSAIAVAKCRDTTGAADTAGVNIYGWTTSSSNYIKIWTDPSENYRHQGKWDETKYRIQGNIEIEESFVKIEGLQVKVVANSSSNHFGFKADYADGAEIYISNNIILGEVSGTSDYINGIESGWSASGTGAKLYAWNNIIYNFSGSSGSEVAGIFLNGVYYTNYLYNNTVYNCKNGISVNTGTVIAKNNLSYSNTTDYGSGFDASSANNISKDATSPNSGGTDCGTHSCRSQTVVFKDASRNDFHLSPYDTSAQNSGANVYADGNLAITTDIDGDARPNSTSFDIGADEMTAAIPIYYSVGDSTADHRTCTGGDCTANPLHVTVSGITATFDLAQTATNFGVGDKVTYGGNVCYVVGKISTTVWSCVSATGTTPTAATGATVTGIVHAFQYLESAVDGNNANGAFDASHLNTKDLTANNYQLNIPCYYDSAADTTGVTVQGWTTSTTDYVRIYAPNDTIKEVNQSQQHSGKWDNAKYSLVAHRGTPDQGQIQIAVPYTKIEGLQVQLDQGVYEGWGIRIASIDNSISNSIIRGPVSNSQDWIGGILIYNAGTGFLKLNNNIVYDFIGASNNYGVVHYNSEINVYAYNLTIQNSTIGYARSTGLGTDIIKNTITQNCTNGYNTWDNFNGSDYNLSDLTSDAPSPSYRSDLATSVSFVDATNNDFHLASTDTGAKGYGTNLSQDANLAFQDDIDGESRAGNWDIGADQSTGGALASTTPGSQAITSGLVGYWSFDGSATDWSLASGQVKDVSGNGNNGTAYNTTKSNATEGKMGQALSFNGSSDYVNTSLSLSSTNVITLSFWLNWSNFANDDSMAMELSTNYNSSLGGFLINPNNSGGTCGGAGNFFVGLNGNAGFSSADFARPSANTWHHYVIVMDMSKSTNEIDSVYVDGASQSLNRGCNSNNTGNFGNYNLYMMSRAGSSYFGEGSLDEVRIYNRALSTSEISDLYHLGNMQINSGQTGNNKSNLAGIWSFDGPDIDWSAGSGQIKDRSGNGKDGTVSNLTQSSVTQGKIGQALNFNGSSSYVNIGDVALTGAMTACAWIKADSFDSSENDIIAKSDSARVNRQYNLNITPVSGSEYASFYWKNSAEQGYVSQTTPLSLNTYYYICATRSDGTASPTVNIYVNGVDQSLGTWGSGQTVPNLSANTSIGRDGDYSGYYFDGSIDEVRLYNVALTAAQVQDLYNAGKVSFGGQGVKTVLANNCSTSNDAAAFDFTGEAISSPGYLYSGYPQATQFTLSGSGTVTRYKVYIRSFSTGGTLTAALYSDNSNTVGSIIANTSVSQSITGTGTYEFDLPTPQSGFVDGTKYWLVMSADASLSVQLNYHYDSGSYMIRDGTSSYYPTNRHNVGVWGCFQ